MAGRCQHARRGNGQTLHGVALGVVHRVGVVHGAPARRAVPFPAVG
ncbi:hypothetical protein [Streptomyces europaeiscabiei]|nr:hypothetical protein [Streptomyces europaeiscabiei]MDX2523685.1 hypothetical protein [Streptomyces europaeiscabiei]MDX2771866.1 hypothetical protein [Streptomyces europaeiscabiei]MDX3666770.1 hypothetical protein [Streptomyces europaeiscabiei]MDX3715608.1 hypothetical protein [Streptomyces europaeiscabiei]MDX3780678.1 hypothetical protein [Streptomyces europaeiscabiei]